MDETPTRDITAHDLLKSFAVVIMIADHIGYYFFPDNLWWRAVGRTGFPIWFFLAGHSAGRDISPRLLYGGVVLVVANVIVGLPLLPLNALFSIMLIRKTLDRLMISLQSARWLWTGLAILLALFLPSQALFEYGTVAFMFAIFGCMVRRGADGGYSRQIIRAYMLAIGLIFLASMQISFGFSQAQFFLMAAGTMAVCVILSDFKSKSYPIWSEKLPNGVLWLFGFGGHRTLEIYVVHLLIFKASAFYLGHKDMSLLNFHIF